MGTSDPAALSEYDPAWPVRARHWLGLVTSALADLPGADAAIYDHIGSTSVPGLAAKPFLDLQVQMLPLPDETSTVARLSLLGFRRELGARPDSPGVHSDIPRGGHLPDPAVWSKLLFVHDDARVVLHIRRSDSPWAQYTVWFRDWLCAHPAERRRYETLKRELSARERGKADYDDYTRAKTAFFDEVQDAFEKWARRT